MKTLNEINQFLLHENYYKPDVKQSTTITGISSSLRLS